MEFKKGDKVRYNKDGLKEFEYNIKYGELCFGIVTEVEDNPYLPNEKMITFIDFIGQKHQLREIYLEKDDIDFSYILNLSKLNGTTEKYVNLTKISLNYFENMFQPINSSADYLDLNFDPTEITELCEHVINEEENLFSLKEKLSAIKILEKLKQYKSLKDRQNQLIDYLKEDNLVDLIKNIFNSIEYNIIDEFTTGVIITKTDDGFNFAFSGYTYINNEKKKVNVKDKFIRKK